MGKYYAREVRNDYFDWEIYFDEGEAENLKMWIGGNIRFTSINKDLYEDIGNALDHIYYEIGEYENREVVDNYLKPIDREAFTDAEIRTILECANEWDTDRNDNDETVAKVLSIVYGKEFVTGTFRGCVQGDWLNYICPKETADDKKFMDYIEAVLFATGVEFEITDEKIENPDEFDGVDTYNYYTAEWDDSKVKEDLAEQFGCSVEEIAILKVKDEHHYVKYDYEEI